MREAVALPRSTEPPRKVMQQTTGVLGVKWAIKTPSEQGAVEELRCQRCCDRRTVAKRVVAASENSAPGLTSATGGGTTEAAGGTGA